MRLPSGVVYASCSVKSCLQHGLQFPKPSGLLLAVKADALCHLRLVPVLPGLLYLRCFELSECLLLRTQRQVFQPYAYCPHLRLISK